MNAKSRMRRPRAGGPGAYGFTLTELLVVVGIIALLAAMITPSLHEAVTAARRTAACKANLSNIIKACGQYSLADRGQSLPTIRPEPGNWGDMKEGNPACLWLLIQEGFCPRSAFVCPEVSTIKNWIAPGFDANDFAYSAENDVSTLSYSFISMVRDPTWEVNLADRLTMMDASPTLVVLADQNPRCRMDETALYQYGDYDLSGGAPDADEQSTIAILKTRWRNSANHRRKGQNVSRWDGSVNWLIDPNELTNENDIYTSSLDDVNEERQGKRYDADDPFLIP